MATSKTTVIIVGGIPCVGKSSICASLAKSLGIGIVLSGDYLREFIRPIIAEDSRYTVLNTSVYDSWKKFG
ncbi:MAG: hypothetical protein KGH72_02520 [Candidatus Micrarchaeota archaeon]|nr:hypothetical protein [Candidatus Micrarchaeota archaeon]